MLAGLGAGIGARYTRGSDGTDTADNHFTIPSYTLYDGKLSYDFEKSPLRLKGLKTPGQPGKHRGQEVRQPLRRHLGLLLRPGPHHHPPT
ncbi:ferrichrome-iron receptor [Pseudomonas aeruginosa]|nr:ferrichrome-iron receptor [Pseudomonas aeruginosa]